MTEGRPVFDRVVPAPGIEVGEVLRLAASPDQGSEHPLAEPESFESGTGDGLTTSAWPWTQTPTWR